MRKDRIAVAALLASALVLTACGRRGPLEVPPATPKQAEREAKNANTPAIRIAPNDKPVILDGSGDNVINAGPDAAVDGEPFFLDSLLN
ncbi:lipoprotein [Martelella lutilitoris]|uniref:Lipoprotein n=1 Tax=Martelella lutilitoris TaxID=2583532 RepID=A0A7T7HKW3_9HYPH|nr:lipoprotein [Martelella lutilitoris]QQM31060.1 lipoprotein [Martelella lutilitoris]